MRVLANTHTLMERSNNVGLINHFALYTDIHPHPPYFLVKYYLKSDRKVLKNVVIGLSLRVSLKFLVQIQ